MCGGQLISVLLIYIVNPVPAEDRAKNEQLPIQFPHLKHLSSCSTNSLLIFSRAPLGQYLVHLVHAIHSR